MDREAKFILLAILAVLLFGREKVLDALGTFGWIFAGVALLAIILVILGLIFGGIAACFQFVERRLTQLRNSFVKLPAVIWITKIAHTTTGLDIAFAIPFVALQLFVLWLLFRFQEFQMREIAYAGTTVTLTLLTVGLLIFSHWKRMRALSLLRFRRRVFTESRSSVFNQIIYGLVCGAVIITPTVDQRVQIVRRGPVLECDNIRVEGYPFNSLQVENLSGDQLINLRIVRPGILSDEIIFERAVPLKEARRSPIRCAALTSGQQSVVINEFSGGAHCCSSQTWLIDDSKTIRLEQVDFADSDLAAEQLGFFNPAKNDDRVILDVPDRSLSYFESASVDLPFAYSPILPRFFCFDGKRFSNCTEKFDDEIALRRAQLLAELKKFDVSLLKVVADQRASLLTARAQLRAGLPVQPGALELDSAPEKFAVLSFQRDLLEFSALSYLNGAQDPRQALSETKIPAKMINELSRAVSERSKGKELTSSRISWSDISLGRSAELENFVVSDEKRAKLSEQLREYTREKPVNGPAK